MTASWSIPAEWKNGGCTATTLRASRLLNSGHRQLFPPMRFQSSVGTTETNNRTVSWRLCGDWQIQPIPLEVKGLPASLSIENARTVPECCHLQPTLYPDNPYWGQHLRQINDQAWVYRRSFRIPADTSYRRARLKFEAVDYFASVWVNDCCVGEHEGNFSPFTLDITDSVHPGEENTLTVRVSAPWDKPNPGGSY